MAEFDSEIHEDLFLFSLDFVSVFFPDFLHGFGVADADYHHLVFDLLAYSSSQIPGNGDGPGLVINVVG